MVQQEMPIDQASFFAPFGPPCKLILRNKLLPLAQSQSQNTHLDIISNSMRCVLACKKCIETLGILAEFVF